MKPGGHEGGEGYFLGGIALVIAGLYFFMDSVYVTTGQYGAISRMVGGGRSGMETTSMGIVFLPFLMGVGVLFYDSSKKWGWWLAGLGLTMLVIEMVSRIHFRMEIKSSTFLLMFSFIAAGVGLAIRGLLLNRKKEKNTKSDHK
ncbi:MAG: hypothetical protein KJO21_03720 [Verrucomicrobiae bacterium]|nr:hypothetical protein [Verrucomicrobiae bacterium]NNJ42607.1 hypothetical protein [Akkermansiaceae bacterium]